MMPKLLVGTWFIDLSFCYDFLKFINKLHILGLDFTSFNSQAMGTRNETRRGLLQCSSLFLILHTYPYPGPTLLNPHPRSTRNPCPLQYPPIVHPSPSYCLRRQKRLPNHIKFQYRTGFSQFRKIHNLHKYTGHTYHRAVS